MTNWKTTLAGIASILGGVNLLVQGQIAEGIPLIVAGIGLLFAKDFNITGGTVREK